uniref:Uncharacterized protein n=1 Tax=Buteo japonicus TaxID=224669 RepID=A0A8B9Z0N0_9AVES
MRLQLLLCIVVFVLASLLPAGGQRPEPALCGPKMFRFTKRLTAKRRPKSNFLTTLYQESCRCANCLGEKSLHRSQNSPAVRCHSAL